MSETVEKKWYVVRAVSGQEHKIKGYIETEIASQLFNKQSISIPKAIYKTLLGARNNFKYEECTANEECNKKALEFVVKTESEEAQIDAEIMAMYHSYNAIFYVNSDSIKLLNNPNHVSLKAMSGRIIGEIVSEVCIKHLFIPNVKSVHKVSDVVCQEYPVLINAKDIFSEAMDTASYGILFSLGGLNELYSNAVSFLNESLSLLYID